MWKSRETPVKFTHNLFSVKTAVNILVPMQKSKMAAWGGLTNSCEKKTSEKQRRKGKI